MIRPSSFAAVILVAAGTLAQPAVPQPTLESVVAELAGIRAELGSIVELLGSLERHQESATLMARLRLKQGRVDSLDGELASTRGQLESHEQELFHIRSVAESFFGEMEAELEPRELEERRQQRKMMEREQANLEQRIETLRPRIVELENELTRARGDLQDLEEAVDERLGLR